MKRKTEKDRATPPAAADRLLEWFCAPHLLEEVQGDLHERFRRRAERFGAGYARRQYVREVLCFLKPFALKRTPNQYPSPSLPNTGMLRNYVKITFRTLARNKVYAAINVVGLSIGLAAAMLIILYTKDEVSYDRFHAGHPNLYRITYQSFTPAGGREYETSITGYLQGPRFAEGVPEIRAYVRFRQHQNDVKKGTQIESQEVFLTDPDFFSVFTFPLRSGNPATALEHPRSVVISERMAERYFGTAEALGKTIFFRDSFGDGSRFEPYAVTGVARNCPQNSSIKFDVLLPLVVKKEEMENPSSWFNTNLNTFVALRPGASSRAVAANMNRVYRADAGAKAAAREMAEKYDYHGRRVYGLQPFTDIHLNKDLPAENGLADASNPVYSYILSGIALFILLIACINFVNLTVARSLKRAKEIGIRKVMGGGRTQLIVQFLGESFMLCLAAFVLAVGLLSGVLPAFNGVAGKALSLSYLLDGGLVAGYAALFVATGLLAGFYPALVLSGYSPVQTLYRRFRLASKNYLQRSLVVLQFALASFLIIATLTIYEQFNYLTTKGLGYDDRHVITVNKWAFTPAETKLLKEELTKNPAILAAAAKNPGRSNTSARINGNTELSFVYETIDAGYLPLLRIPVVQGRNFSPDFSADSVQSVLVNETFVKKAGWKRPIGQVVDFWYDAKKYNVVGVVKDHHYAALNEEIKPQVFTLKSANRYGKAFIRIRPGTETASLHHLGKTFRRLFPVSPYAYQFLDQENLKRYEAEAKWKQIMLFGAVLTIFISCIGLFGLATLSAERRTKEIGIRKVLGASVPGIVGLLSSDFLKLVGFSFVFAFPAAGYAMRQWLQNYPYRTSLDAWIFAGAAALAMLIAFCTVSFQSIKAALTNPVNSLRSE